VPFNELQCAATGRRGLALPIRPPWQNYYGGWTRRRQHVADRRFSLRRFMVREQVRKEQGTFHEPKGRASSPLRADDCNHDFLQRKARRAESDAPTSANGFMARYCGGASRTLPQRPSRSINSS
jgi:hypothetical protein